jgi:hypothetical protein
VSRNETSDYESRLGGQSVELSQIRRLRPPISNGGTRRKKRNRRNKECVKHQHRLKFRVPRSGKLPPVTGRIAPRIAPGGFHEISGGG